MQKFLLLCLLLIAKSTLAQVKEPFNYLNFNEDQKWKFDTASWLINQGNQLQSKRSAIAKTIFLTTQNSIAINVQWEFWLRLDFDPSASNQIRIYLLADQTDLSGALNGYFLQIGKTGNTDNYELYRQTGTRSIRIGETPPIPRRKNNQLITRIKVIRDKAGLWTVLSDEDSGYDFIAHFSVTDNNYTTASTFGIRCAYTATRSNQFFFDDIVIKEFETDNTPPKMIAAKALDSITLQVDFDETMNKATAGISLNYLITNKRQETQIIDSISGNAARWLVHLKNALHTDSYQLLVKNLTDLNGNILASDFTLSFNFIRLHDALPGEVVINEIFANVDPPVGLPSAKFIELHNPTPFYISLKNWEYRQKTTRFTFGNDTIGPGAYVILCAKADTGLFKPHGQTIGLSPWPSPNISGDLLSLINANGVTIHQVTYLESWYRDSQKKKGGWTLELMDAESSCSGFPIWGASTDAIGGTPGKQNAIYLANHSTLKLQLLKSQIIDSLEITIEFNHATDSSTSARIQAYTINNGVRHPSAAIPQGPDFRQIVLQFSNPLQPGLRYRLSVDNIKDCGGGIIDETHQEVEFMLTPHILVNDIVINEVLFNPKEKGADFVEIYNRSDKTLDLKELTLATLDEPKDALKSVKQISDSTRLFSPGEYLVLTTNPENIKDNYHCENPAAFLKMASLPAFNNDRGIVILAAKGKRIDQLNYSERMHFNLFKNNEGVSLERVDSERPTNESGNFQSAAAFAGFATPTYTNSVSHIEQPSTSMISFIDKIFSPDQDGFQDLLTVKYNFSETGIVASITIYNDQGRLVKKLVRNQTMAQAGELTWDGLNDNLQLSPIGIYILHTEIFDLRGNVKKQQHTFVLAGKLD
ncbi:MAG: lamin tail domain-containing protein [Sphingobacteriaceae bacterium]